jgi:hypothetical protein
MLVTNADVRFAFDTLQKGHCVERISTCRWHVWQGANSIGISCSVDTGLASDKGPYAHGESVGGPRP